MAAIAGLVSSIISLVDFGVKVASRLSEFHSQLVDGPETLRILVVQIPLLNASLKRLKEQADKKVVDDDVARALLPVIEETANQIKTLDEHLDKVLPSQDDPKWKVSVRALRSVFSEDSTKKTVDRIRFCIDVLTLQQSTTSVELILQQTTTNVNLNADIIARLRKLAEHPLSEAQDRPSQNDLQHAVNQSDLSSIWAMHQLGADLNGVDERGNTLLHTAAQSGQMGTVRLLLKFIKDVDAVNYEGKTALHVAIALGRVEVAKVLLECGARKDVKDDHGKTPLDYARQDFLSRWVIQAACANEHVAVRQLLERGASVDATNNLSRTALAEACSRGHVATVDVLLSQGADPNSVDQENWSPFTRCIWANQIEALRKVVGSGRADVNTTSTKNGLPAVNEAARRQCWPIVEFLLESGAEPNYASDPMLGSHKSLLRRAVMNSNDDEVVRMVLHYGADKDGKDHDGWTPMAEAVESKKWSIMQVLLEAGAEPNGLHPGTGLKYRDYPFIVRLAQWNSETKYIRMLVHHGAKVDAVNNDGWTALSEAVSAGSVDLVCELLKLGANASHRVRKRYRGHENTPLLVLAMWKGEHPAVIISALVAHGANLEDATAAGWTAMRLAVERANSAAASALLLRGANPNAVAEDGRTPAQVAREKRLNPFCTLLDTRWAL